MNKHISKKLSAFLLTGSLLFLSSCATNNSLQTKPVSSKSVKTSIVKKIEKKLPTRVEDLKIREITDKKGRKSYLVDIGEKNGYELSERGIPTAMTYREFILYFNQVIEIDLEEIWEAINSDEDTIKTLYDEKDQMAIKLIKREFDDSPYFKDKEKFIAYHSSLNNRDNILNRLYRPHEDYHANDLEKNPIKREINARLSDLEREGYEYLDLSLIIQIGSKEDYEQYEDKFQTPLATYFIGKEYQKRTHKDLESLSRKEISQIAQDIRIDLERGAFPEEDFKYN